MTVRLVVTIVVDEHRSYEYWLFVCLVAQHRHLLERRHRHMHLAQIKRLVHTKNRLSGTTHTLNVLNLVICVQGKRWGFTCRRK